MVAGKNIRGQNGRIKNTKKMFLQKPYHNSTKSEYNIRVMYRWIVYSYSCVFIYTKYDLIMITSIYST